MNRPRAIIAIGWLLLSAALTGCQTGTCCQSGQCCQSGSSSPRRGFPIEYRVFDSQDGDRCPGCAACGGCQSCESMETHSAFGPADKAISAEISVEQPVEDEILTPFAGLAGHHVREPAIPPPHDPWFYAVPTTPVFPLAGEAVMPSPGPYGPEIQEPYPQPPEIIPPPIHEIPPPVAQPSSSAAREPGEPSRLPEHQAGPWLFRPARNHATKHEQRAVRRVDSDTAVKTRKPAAF